MGQGRLTRANLYTVSCGPAGRQVWILTGALFAITLVVSDLCVDPALNVVNFAGSSPELGFFLGCSALSAEQRLEQNPFSS